MHEEYYLGTPSSQDMIKAYGMAADSRGVARILSMGGGLDNVREAREKISRWPRPLIRIT